MLVTQVTELSKSRSKVYIDQEFAFVLYKGELRLYHIKEGEELVKGRGLPDHHAGGTAQTGEAACHESAYRGGNIPTSQLTDETYSRAIIRRRS